MDVIVLFFGSSRKEGNDEANLIHVILAVFSAIVQLNLDILYETLGVLRVTIERVNPKTLRLFGLVSGSLAIPLPLAKLQKSP